MTSKDIVIVCAASTIDNGLPTSRGGISVATTSLDYDLEESQRITGPTTNNACELLSVLRAVEMAPTDGSVHVFSASEYVVSNLGLIPKWQSNGWRNSGRKPVANKELWMSLHDSLKSKPGVSIRLFPKTDEAPEIGAAHIACQGLAQAAARLANSRPQPAMPERAHMQLVEDDSPIF